MTTAKLQLKPLIPSWSGADSTSIAAKDGADLFVRSRSVSNSRGVVLLTHGLGEHSGRYAHVMEALLARELRVCAWDLRGHGRSAGMRGDAETYELLVDDLHRVAEFCREEGKPLFFYAHSLGAQVTLRFLEQFPAACAGAVIASPWLRLAFDPPWWKLGIARLAMRFAPAFTQRTGMRPQRLSRDEAHLASLPDLHLVHHQISARMFFAVRAAAAEALLDAPQLRTPLLLLHGEDDPVTSHLATREFFDRVASPDKTLRLFPGGRHETHNDLDRAQVIREACDWIEARLNAQVERDCA